MGDKIHPTHFQVPEMPWREKEKQALTFLKTLLELINNADIIEASGWYLVAEYMADNHDLIDWVMKYKGE